MAVFPETTGIIALPLSPLAVIADDPKEATPSPRRPHPNLRALEVASTRRLMGQEILLSTDDEILELQPSDSPVGFFANVDLELLLEEEENEEEGYEDYEDEDHEDYEDDEDYEDCEDYEDHEDYADYEDYNDYNDCNDYRDEAGFGLSDYNLLLVEVEPGRLCPNYCYGRVSRSLRRVLSKRGRRLPLCFLERLETELKRGLRNEEDSMQFLLENPFQRLLVHALAQYYGLSSRSEDEYEHECGENGDSGCGRWRRVTSVWLPRNHCGRLPAISLARHLQQR